MGKIKVHAGDFDTIDTMGKDFLVPGKSVWKVNKIPFTDLESVELASEESVKKVGGTVGWGAAGAVILGPVGLLAGLLLGGRKKKVTFVAKFKDGRKLLGTTDSKTFTKLQAAIF